MAVGDRLARGDQSANFSVHSRLSDFANDLLFSPEIVAQKYGLSQAQVDEYQNQRLAGEDIPDLPVKQEVEEGQPLGFTVTDRRLLSSTGRAAAKEAPKFPRKQYSALRPVLDRILVMRVTTDSNLVIQEDGSILNENTGMVQPAKYRQHSNTAVVLAAGDLVILGGQKVAMAEIVKPGDRVTYGDYNSEVFMMPEKKVRQLCDALEVNYEADPQGLRIVRVQDVRGIERPTGEVENE